MPRFTKGAAAAVLAVATAAASSAAPQGGTPDTVFRLNPRNNEAQSIVCSVTEDGLETLKATMRDGKEQRYESSQIIEVIWGDVPSSFTDGVTYSKRSDWEQAVQSFQEAAGDTDTRPAVQAAARMQAIEAHMSWGATDPAHFADAIAEADRFLSDFAANRNMPAVRAMKARAAWLSGDAATARDGYKALHDAGKGGTAGYRPLLVAQAALDGAQAALDADDTPGATELYSLAATAFGAVEAATPRDVADVAAGKEIAALGDALAKVARGDHAGSKRTFEKAIDKSATSAGKSTARLGLGMALLAEGKAREAQLEFAWVAGLDHTSADRRAAALVGLAQSALAADAATGAAAAKTALERVRREYGQTPSAARAAELLQTM